MDGIICEQHSPTCCEFELFVKPLLLSTETGTSTSVFVATAPWRLLLELKIREQNYLLAVRSATVLLKRNPNELRSNNYNAACLSAWRANMDIQFVLDVYACAVYIENYISKAQKGMSELLREACTEARKGNACIT